MLAKDLYRTRDKGRLLILVRRRTLSRNYIYMKNYFVICNLEYKCISGICLKYQYQRYLTGIYLND